LSSKIYIGQSYFFNHVNLSVRWQKVALLALGRVGLRVRQSQMCHHTTKPSQKSEEKAKYWV